LLYTIEKIPVKYLTKELELSGKCIGAFTECVCWAKENSAQYRAIFEALIFANYMDVLPEN